MATTGNVGAACTDDGCLDLRFGTLGVATLESGLASGRASLALTNDDGILVAETNYLPGARGEITVHRLSADGRQDDGFGRNGSTRITSPRSTLEVSALAVDAEGRIVVVGTERQGSRSDLFLARLTSSGRLDDSFGSEGTLSLHLGGSETGAGVCVPPTGEIVAAATRVKIDEQTGARDQRPVVIRLSPDGDLDPAFAGRGRVAIDLGSDASAHGVIAGADGSVLLLASRAGADGGDLVVVKLTASGERDRTFNGSGKRVVNLGADESGAGLALTPDAKIVVAGSRALGSESDFVVIRLRADGTLDQTFSGNGKRTIDFGGEDRAAAMLVGADARITVVGSRRLAGGSDDLAVARLRADGSLDPDFSRNGKTTVDHDGGDDQGFGVGIQRSGKLVVAGFSTSLVGRAVALSRYRSLLHPPVGALENPPLGGGTLSGIGVASGWVCPASEVVVEFDGTSRLKAANGTPRADTAAACGGTDNGFALLFNWNLLGDGPHRARVLADGIEIADVPFFVKTPGTDFLPGLTGQFTVSGFPSVGDKVALTWQEPLQGFVISSATLRRRDPRALAMAEPTVAATQPGPVVPPPAAQTVDPGVAVHGSLEIPPPDSFASGIGIVSGWACPATVVEIEIDESLRLRAGTGTPRDDTRDECGVPDTGFGMLINWGLLGNGSHTIRALADGNEIGRARVQVTTLGSAFRRGLSGRYRLPDFPTRGRATIVEWAESRQGFGIVDITP